MSFGTKSFMSFQLLAGLLFLLGNPNTPAQIGATQSQNLFTLPSRLPFEITAVETPETKERKDLTSKVTSLLKAKDYDKLDEIATKLRASKERWATGHWKVANVYSGLVPSDDTPDIVWEARLAELKSWIAARTNSITARVALAYVLVDYAWKARGSGWAGTVNDEGWRLFEQRLNEAERVMDEAKNLKDHCPVYWSVKMRSALGLGTDREQFDSIFNEAIHSVPDYDAYYFHRAKYLLPRWYGNEGEWESDLAKWADRVGGEHGDEVYAQVVWCIHRGVGFKNIFKENKLSWARVDKGFEIIEKHYPDSLAAKNERAHLAVLARDFSKAHTYFDDTAGKVDLSEWKSQEEFARFARTAYGL